MVEEKRISWSKLVQSLNRLVHEVSGAANVLG